MTQEQRLIYLEDVLRGCATEIAKGTADSILAIRAWRAATGATLKDSKDYVMALKLATESPAKYEDARIQRLEDRLFHLEQRVNGIFVTTGHGGSADR
jgi:ribosomal protein L7/L12